MHSSAYEFGRLFFENYGTDAHQVIVDIGSQNVNGTLRDHCPADRRYIGLDMMEGDGVDIVVAPHAPLPFDDASVDIIVTSSCFEHDMLFWEAFLEAVRVLKDGGLLYFNAPSNGPYHRYPVDCWRFYPDAGLALRNLARQRGYELDLQESFVSLSQEGWRDFVAVFSKGRAAVKRKGRIADNPFASNIYDIATNGDVLEKEHNLIFLGEKEAASLVSTIDHEKDKLIKEQKVLIEKMIAVIEILKRDLSEIKTLTEEKLQL